MSMRTRLDGVQRHALGALDDRPHRVARAGPATSPARSSRIGARRQRLEVRSRRSCADRAPQPGRRSSSSGRAASTTKIGHGRGPVEQVVDEVEQARGRPIAGPRRRGRPCDWSASRSKKVPPGGEQLLARPPAASSRPSSARSARLDPAPLGRRRGRAPRASPRVAPRVVGSSSLSAMPARPRTISPSAQNVMPSP